MKTHEEMKPSPHIGRARLQPDPQANQGPPTDARGFAHLYELIDTLQRENETLRQRQDGILEAMQNKADRMDVLSQVTPVPVKQPSQRVAHTTSEQRAMAHDVGSMLIEHIAEHMMQKPELYGDIVLSAFQSLELDRNSYSAPSGLNRRGLKQPNEPIPIEDVDFPLAPKTGAEYKQWRQGLGFSNAALAERWGYASGNSLWLWEKRPKLTTEMIAKIKGVSRQFVLNHGLN